MSTEEVKGSKKRKLFVEIDITEYQTLRAIDSALDHIFYKIQHAISSGSTNGDVSDKPSASFRIAED